MKRAGTIKELAKALDLSVGTVSAALNNRSTAKPATRQRVREEAERIGYVRSYAARSMSEGRSRKLDLVIPAVGGRALSGFTSEVLAGADAAAEGRGYRLGLNVIATERALRERVARLARERAADGFVFFNPDHSDLYAALRKHHVPHVVVGRPAVADAASVRVDTDNVRLGREMGQHLAARNRREVLFLAPRVFTFAVDRFRGLREVLGGAVRWVDCPPSTVGAERALAGELERRTHFDAVVAADDLLALGALHELQRRGCVVPDDVAVASTADDIAPYLHPPLTGVALHPEQLGATAVTVLIDSIEGRSSPAVTWIDHALRVRAST